MANEDRTPKRLLLIGYTGFAGIEAVSWADLVSPNILDYDLVVISVPHMTEDFLKDVDSTLFENVKRALVQFLHSQGKLIILMSPVLNVKRANKYPEWVCSLDWCPLKFVITNEAGQSIVRKSSQYDTYLRKMDKWSFYIDIPNSCLTYELTDFYGSPHEISYKVSLEPYIENRYSRLLAGQGSIQVTRGREKSSYFNTYKEYPNEPDHVTGPIVILPLIEGISSEEALLDILKEEVVYSLRSPAPDWAQEIEIPSVSELNEQIAHVQAIIAKEEQNISALEEKVDELTSFRRLLRS